MERQCRDVVICVEMAFEHQTEAYSQPSCDACMYMVSSFVSVIVQAQPLHPEDSIELTDAKTSNQLIERLMGRPPGDGLQVYDEYMRLAYAIDKPDSDTKHKQLHP